MKFSSTFFNEQKICVLKVASGDVEVGKLKIIKYPGQKSQVSLSLSDATMNIDPEEAIPREHKFDVLAVNKQTLGVFSQHGKMKKLLYVFYFSTLMFYILVDPERADKLYMEGKIVEKLECTPYADSLYMSMKAKSIKMASQPKRRVEQLDKVVTNYKPISDHKHNVSFLYKSFKILNFYKIYFRLSTKRTRKMLERNREQIKMQSWIFFLMPSRSINITTLRILSP